MEYVFSEPPTSGPTGSSNNQTRISQESHLPTSDATTKDPFTRLTHIDCKGEAQIMVDISPKEIIKRVDIRAPQGVRFSFGQPNGKRRRSRRSQNCRDLWVHLDLKLNPRDLSVEIQGEAVSTGKTGVEMEALTAVSIAGLTVYDMCKAGSKNIQITDIMLEHKRGGKSGDWSRS
ncbi:hypothetical protein CASFOL_033660 [Castilleja foliolosa]|uniref:Molybdopterin cofactor biosynthesis C (MoaC) domain-containing protein n=1 Tax=Castilleja foliolosa TaxID=1961234 RepID=A0ABD3BYE1_9LAMI